MPNAQGPLTGIKIVELAGIGPGPFAAMLLSDLGADVMRVDRAQNVSGGDPESPPLDLLNRGRRSVGVDLKQADGVETVLRLVDQADVLIEGFRPGVMERLGLGPDVCLARNPRLVYGRMTGWGQDGPLAQRGRARHQLHLADRRAARDRPPRRGAGAAAQPGRRFRRRRAVPHHGRARGARRARASGKGQVVDAAMTDGSASLMTIFYGLKHLGFWKDERGVNLLDTGAHFYDVYETKDGKYVSVGSIEPQFYQLLLKHTGLAGETLPAQFDREQWPALKEKRRGDLPHQDARRVVRDHGGHRRLLRAGPRASTRRRTTRTTPRAARSPRWRASCSPAPAPRFSRTPGAIQRPPAHPGQHTDEALADWGFSPAELARLREQKAIA